MCGAMDLKPSMQMKHKVDKLGLYLLKQWKMKHDYVKIFLSFKQQPLLNNESHFFSIQSFISSSEQSLKLPST